MPGSYNFTVPQGDTLVDTITWRSGGSPVDLTGFTAEMVVWDSAQQTLATYSTGSDGGITLGGDAGTIAIEAQTAGLDAGCYSYFLRLTSSGGIVTTLLEGAFQVRPVGPQEVAG